MPSGVADYFWHGAYARRLFQSKLLDTFHHWGYGDIILPTFEYADTLSSHATPTVAQQMYRFPDRDGSMLALRTDMTISVARLVGTRLFDWPMPQRYSYSGNVFRYVDQPQAGRQREFAQVGIELIGASGAGSDGEILALCANALQDVGLRNFQMVVGQIGYFNSLLEELSITPEQQQQLVQAIQRNSQPLIELFLENTSLSTEQRCTVENLPSLSGYAVPEIFEKASELCLNSGMEDALDNLRQIYDVLVAYDVASYCYLDMTEIRDLGYYTGLTFEILAPELGFPIASGGRYDELVGFFGNPQPAVGAAIGLDRLLLAYERQLGNENQAPRPVQPDLIVAATQSHACIEIVQAWRAKNIHVVVDVVEQRSGPELWQEAQKLSINFVVAWNEEENGFDLYADPKSSTPSQFVAVADQDKILEMIGWSE